MPRLTRRVLFGFALLPLAGCGYSKAPVRREPAVQFSGNTPEMQALVARYARALAIPPELLHHVISVESGYNPGARNGPYYGLMQINPDTARTMGYSGPPSGLLDPETNLRFAGAYLRGAYIVANGDLDDAYSWYRRGYYYEARDRGLLEETGLRRG
jgi:soluble lytic murein transglycosylase-like protein